MASLPLKSCLGKDEESNVPPEERSPSCASICCCSSFIALILSFIAAAPLVVAVGVKPVYYGAIAAASATPPGEFKVSLGVASVWPFSRGCFEQGMALGVFGSGSGNQLIAGGNVSETACAPRWPPAKMVVTHVVAMGGGADRAAMETPWAEFDVMLRLPADGEVVVCRGRRIGDPLAPCCCS